MVVVPDRRVEIAVVRSVAATAGIGLANSAATVNEDFLEAAAVREVRILIAEVPFAENAGGVTGVAQKFGDGAGLQAEALAFKNGVGDAGTELVFAGQQRGAGGRAGGADVKLSEPDAF